MSLILCITFLGIIILVTSVNALQPDTLNSEGVNVVPNSMK